MATKNKSGLLRIIALSTLLLCLGMSANFAQIKSTVDSASYETQRAKVNSLLEQRKQKFGEFDQSVLKKSGVFGLFKSKRDMQQSIDILKAVVINDNHIFIETQKLLSMKDFEKDHFQRLADEYDTRSSAYMRTITKLQTENEKLRSQVGSLDEEDHQNNVWLYLLSILTLGLLSYVIYLQRRISTAKK